MSREQYHLPMTTGGLQVNSSSGLPATLSPIGWGEDEVRGFRVIEPLLIGNCYYIKNRTKLNIIARFPVTNGYEYQPN